MRGVLDSYLLPMTLLILAADQPFVARLTQRVDFVDVSNTRMRIATVVASLSVLRHSLFSLEQVSAARRLPQSGQGISTDGSSGTVTS